MSVLALWKSKHLTARIKSKEIYVCLNLLEHVGSAIIRVARPPCHSPMHIRRGLSGTCPTHHPMVNSMAFTWGRPIWSKWILIRGSCRFHKVLFSGWSFWLEERIYWIFGLIRAGCGDLTSFALIWRLPYPGSQANKSASIRWVLTSFLRFDRVLALGIHTGEK